MGGAEWRAKQSVSQSVLEDNVSRVSKERRREEKIKTGSLCAGRWSMIAGAAACAWVGRL